MKDAIELGVLLGIVISVVMIVGACLMYVFSMIDDRREAAYDRYDSCVQSQYGMTSAQYYQQTGVIPKCDR